MQAVKTRNNNNDYYHIFFSGKKNRLMPDSNVNHDKKIFGGFWNTTSLAGHFSFLFFFFFALSNFVLVFILYFLFSFLNKSSVLPEETTLRVFPPSSISRWEFHFIWCDNLFFILFNDSILFFCARLRSSVSLTITINVWRGSELHLGILETGREGWNQNNKISDGNHRLA